MPPAAVLDMRFTSSESSLQTAQFVAVRLGAPSIPWQGRRCEGATTGLRRMYAPPVCRSEHVIRGGLLEVFTGVWLIARGFRLRPYV